MTDDGEIVQVEYMLYTTTTKAYKNIDLDLYGDLINKLLMSYQSPVEVSTICSMMNMQCNVSYSRTFYFSLTKHLSRKFSWNRSGTLFSNKSILYKNLSDAITVLYNSNLSIKDNISVIQNKVIAERTVIDYTIRNNKIHLRANVMCN